MYNMPVARAWTSSNGAPRATNDQMERSRHTPPARRSGNGQRGLTASHAARLSFRIGPEHWLLAGVVCCAVLILSGVRAFAPSLEEEARTPPPVAINVQASTDHELDRTGYAKGLYISRAAWGTPILLSTSRISWRIPS